LHFTDLVIILLIVSRSGEKAVMEKISKIVFVLCASMAFCFAQVADTSSQSATGQNSKPVVQIGSATTTPNGNFNIPTGVITPKKPTNWSKIKDLFL
jgi:hypothetical protein